MANCIIEIKDKFKNILCITKGKSKTKDESEMIKGFKDGRFSALFISENKSIIRKIIKHDMFNSPIIGEIHLFDMNNVSFLYSKNGNINDLSFRFFVEKILVDVLKK